jgi:hypothetical protein
MRLTAGADCGGCGVGRRWRVHTLVNQHPVNNPVQIAATNTLASRFGCSDTRIRLLRQDSEAWKG